jgi:hypothetical protein
MAYTSLNYYMSSLIWTKISNIMLVQVLAAKNDITYGYFGGRALQFVVIVN